MLVLVSRTPYSVLSSQLASPGITPYRSAERSAQTPGLGGFGLLCGSDLDMIAFSILGYRDVAIVQSREPSGFPFYVFLHTCKSKWFKTPPWVGVRGAGFGSFFDQVLG